MSVINAVPKHDARKVSFLIRVRLQFADTAYTISVLCKLSHARCIQMRDLCITEENEAQIKQIAADTRTLTTGSESFVKNTICANMSTST